MAWFQQYFPVKFYSVLAAAVLKTIKIINDKIMIATKMIIVILLTM